MTHGRAFSMMLSNVLVIHCDNEKSEIKHKKSNMLDRLSDYHALEIGMPSEW